MSSLSPASRRLAGILLVLYPTVVFGGVSLLSMLINRESGYIENPIRQDLWRAGHAHAAVLLMLSLVVLRYVDETNLSDGWQQVARNAVPLAAILMPVAFFLSVLPADATGPNGLIFLAFGGAISLVVGLFTLGVGLLRGPRVDG